MAIFVTASKNSSQGVSVGNRNPITGKIEGGTQYNPNGSKVVFSPSGQGTSYAPSGGGGGGSSPAPTTSTYNPATDISKPVQPQVNITQPTTIKFTDAQRQAIFGNLNLQKQQEITPGQNRLTASQQLQQGQRFYPGTATGRGTTTQVSQPYTQKDITQMQSRGAVTSKTAITELGRREGEVIQNKFNQFTDQTAQSLYNKDTEKYNQVYAGLNAAVQVGNITADEANARLTAYASQLDTTRNINLQGQVDKWQQSYGVLLERQAKEKLQDISANFAIKDAVRTLPIVAAAGFGIGAIPSLIPAASGIVNTALLGTAAYGIGRTAYESVKNPMTPKTASKFLAANLISTAGFGAGAVLGGMAFPKVETIQPEFTKQVSAVKAIEKSPGVYDISAQGRLIKVNPKTQQRISATDVSLTGELLNLEGTKGIIQKYSGVAGTTKPESLIFDLDVVAGKLKAGKPVNIQKFSGTSQFIPDKFIDNVMRGTAQTKIIEVGKGKVNLELSNAINKAELNLIPETKPATFTSLTNLKVKNLLETPGTIKVNDFINVQGQKAFSLSKGVSTTFLESIGKRNIASNEISGINLAKSLGLTFKPEKVGFDIGAFDIGGTTLKANLKTSTAPSAVTSAVINQLLDKTILGQNQVIENIKPVKIPSFSSLMQETKVDEKTLQKLASQQFSVSKLKQSEVSVPSTISIVKQNQRQNLGIKSIVSQAQVSNQQTRQLQRQIEKLTQVQIPQANIPTFALPKLDIPGLFGGLGSSGGSGSKQLKALFKAPRTPKSAYTSSLLAAAFNLTRNVSPKQFKKLQSQTWSGLETRPVLNIITRQKGKNAYSQAQSNAKQIVKQLKKSKSVSF
jgi:hypothetical protein